MDYARILDRVVAELKTRSEVLGILVGGSYITGQMGPTSDLDLQVVTGSDGEQRVVRRIDGVQVETWSGSPADKRRAFETEADGATLIMFAQGRVLYDPRGLVAELKHEAESLYTAGPSPLSEQRIAELRFGAQDALDDVGDLVSVGSPVTLLALMQTLDLVLTIYYRLQRHWKPKPKYLLLDLAGQDRVLTGLVRACLEEFGMQRKYILLREIAERVVEPVGGLSQEYSSAAEDMLKP